ncbi:MAG TPA: PH domain-containing protein [Patescibacteria group bacterium]|nr:PH domain-containing protein [Patescibacteria group bacterium]
MKQLDPKFVWLYFVSSSLGLLILFPFLFFFFLPIFLIPSFYTMGDQTENTSFVIGSGFTFIFFILAIILILNFFWAKLTYKYYRYELREDGFRKEHGVIWKKYVTIPYERIQNVDIYRGLLARIFGLSDLNIQTAGMSSTVGSYGGGAEGRLPGLSPQVAEQLRDELIKRARGKQQGL